MKKVVLGLNWEVAGALSIVVLQRFSILLQ